jgi:uncharacterized membrane protein (DUF4010 family)
VELDVSVRLAVALGLGLLVGLQREATEPHVAGIRTFALLTLLGALLGLLKEWTGAWVLAAGLLCVTTVLVGGAIVHARRGERPGLTTEVAALVMYAVGATVAWGHVTLGVLVGGVVAVLLQWKKPLHGFAGRMDEHELTAIFRLTLIGAVLLPVLPDRSYDPYGVINPFRIWLMVALICGITLVSYIAYRFLGRRAGTILGGLLGGLVSSTATTVSHARLSRASSDAARSSALVIAIASTVVFARIAFEVAVVAPQHLGSLLPPLGIVTAALAVGCGWLFATSRLEGPSEMPERDPLQLKTALGFGLLYALVLLGVAVAKEHLGDPGLYTVSVLSGLTDVDAITLSTAQMLDAGRLDVGIGWRMILVGAMSNLVFKAGIVALLGSRRTLKLVTLVFAGGIAAGALVLLLWPA